MVVDVESVATTEVVDVDSEQTTAVDAGTTVATVDEAVVRDAVVDVDVADSSVSDADSLDSSVVGADAEGVSKSKEDVAMCNATTGPSGEGASDTNTGAATAVELDVVAAEGFEATDVVDESVVVETEEKAVEDVDCGLSVAVVAAVVDVVVVVVVVVVVDEVVAEAFCRV